MCKRMDSKIGCHIHTFAKLYVRIQNIGTEMLGFAQYEPFVPVIVRVWIFNLNSCADLSHLTCHRIGLELGCRPLFAIQVGERSQYATGWILPIFMKKKK